MTFLTAVRYGVDAAVVYHGDTEKYLSEVDGLHASLLMHLPRRTVVLIQLIQHVLGDFRSAVANPSLKVEYTASRVTARGTARRYSWRSVVLRNRSAASRITSSTTWAGRAWATGGDFRSGAHALRCEAFQIGMDGAILVVTMDQLALTAVFSHGSAETRRGTSANDMLRNVGAPFIYRSNAVGVYRKSTVAPAL
jgi:hypothetical protein